MEIDTHLLSDEQINKINETVAEMLNYMKILKECINDLQKDCENKLKTIDNFTDKLSTLDEKIRYLEDELSAVDDVCRRIINVKKL